MTTIAPHLSVEALGQRLDNAGWHAPADLRVPDGIRLEFLPPYSPELQPAEHLWPLLDEPLVNRNFANLEDLEATLSSRCRTLTGLPQLVRDHTRFYCWRTCARRELINRSRYESGSPIAAADSKYARSGY